MPTSSICSRVAAFSLTISLGWSAATGQDIKGGASTLNATDISGGANVLLASAEVEAKLGKGIFTAAQSKPHAIKPLEKNILPRSVKAAHASKKTASNRTGRTSGRVPGTGNIAGNTGGTGNNSSGTTNRGIDVSGPASGGAARRALTAEDYNKQGDDYFDEDKFDKAAEAYQQAVRMKTDY